MKKFPLIFLGWHAHTHKHTHAHTAENQDSPDFSSPKLKAKSYICFEDSTSLVYSCRSDVSKLNVCCYTTQSSCLCYQNSSALIQHTYTLSLSLPKVTPSLYINVSYVYWTSLSLCWERVWKSIFRDLTWQFCEATGWVLYLYLLTVPHGDPGRLYYVYIAWFQSDFSLSQEGNELFGSMTWYMQETAFRCFSSVKNVNTTQQTVRVLSLRKRKMVLVSFLL